MHFSIPVEKAAIQYNGDDSVAVYSLFFFVFLGGGEGGGASLFCGVALGVVYGLKFVFLASPGHTHLLCSKKD